MIDTRFPKEERLRSRKQIQNLFEKAKRFHIPPVQIFYHAPGLELERGVQILVGAPKKRFKKAVDRNRIKRQLREGLREADSQNLFYGNCMLIFTGKKASETMVLKEEISALFNKMKPDSF